MGLLGESEIRCIFNAAMAAGLEAKRDILLSGLPLNLIDRPHLDLGRSGNMPQMPQILSDLHTLNEAPQRDTGFLPLELWLEHAVALVSPGNQMVTFHEALRTIRSMLRHQAHRPKDLNQAMLLADSGLPRSSPPLQKHNSSSERFADRGTLVGGLSGIAPPPSLPPLVPQPRISATQFPILALRSTGKPDTLI